MARKSNLLTHKEVQSLSAPGVYADGAGLYLVVRPSRAKGGVERPPAKSWVFVYFREKRRCEVGLGGAADTKLSDVRAKAEELRRLVAAGGDPKAKPEPIRPAVNFGQVADEVIDTLSWRNAKTLHQWRYSLQGQAESLRALAPEDVTTERVLEVLRPVWSKTPESARRLRARIEAVLDAAAAKGLRDRANPARWKGHLEHLLAARPPGPQRHFPAMPYEQAPAFMATLRSRRGVSPSALRFLILTAARTTEVLELTWPEVNLEARLWIVPADRMKAHREHRVPLVDEACDILRDTLGGRAQASLEGYVFPGARPGRPLSNMALDAVLRREKLLDITVHGFRSTFRDWVGEETDFPEDLAEAALAHVRKNKVERAYRRGDALAKRRLLMEAWAAYLRPSPTLRSATEAPEASPCGSAPDL